MILQSHGVGSSRWLPLQTFDPDGSALDTLQCDFTTVSTNMFAVVKDLEQLGVGVSFGEVVASDVVFRMSGTLNRLAANVVTKQTAALLNALEAERTVKEFLAKTQANARLSTDFFAYLTMASCLAATGLSAGLGVVLVAAVLLSPLMGPIIQAVVGILIRDPRLIATALAKEILGLFYAFVIGGLMSAIFSRWATQDPMHWPNRDMILRGSNTGMLLAAATGAPAGAAVAWTSISGTPVVGAAISAGLLPPIINAGMNFYFATIGHTYAIGDVSRQQVSRHWVLCGKALAVVTVTIGTAFTAALLVFAGRRFARARFGGASFDLLTLVNAVKASAVLNATQMPENFDRQSEARGAVDSRVPDSAVIQMNGEAISVGELRRTVSMRLDSKLQGQAGAYASGPSTYEFSRDITASYSSFESD